MKIKKLIIGAVLSVLCLTGVTACQKAEDTSGNVGEVTISSGDTVAEIEIEGYGTIKAKLFPDIAPIGVENFKQLADQGYYDGKNIHRVIEGFMMPPTSAPRSTGTHVISTAHSATPTPPAGIPLSSTL